MEAGEDVSVAATADSLASLAAPATAEAPPPATSLLASLAELAALWDSADTASNGALTGSTAACCGGGGAGTDGAGDGVLGTDGAGAPVTDSTTAPAAPSASPTRVAEAIGVLTVKAAMRAQMMKSARFNLL